MTRDPARIDPILADLRRYWHAAPDLRLGQMVMGLLNLSGAPRYGEFNAEDDKVAAYLAAWAAANPPPPDHRDTLPPEIEAAIADAGQALVDAWDSAQDGPPHRFVVFVDPEGDPEVAAGWMAMARMHAAALAAAREAGRREVAPLRRENEVLRSNSDHLSSENASLASQVESMALRIESLAEELAKPEDVRLREVLDALDGRAVIFDGLGARVGHLLDEMDEWIERAGVAERRLKKAEEVVMLARQLTAYLWEDRLEDCKVSDEAKHDSRELSTAVWLYDQEAKS